MAVNFTYILMSLALVVVVHGRSYNMVAGQVSEEDSCEARHGAIHRLIPEVTHYARNHGPVCMTSFCQGICNLECSGTLTTAQCIDGICWCKLMKT